tara:strand:- start:6610 stop:7911 length:1302 start_codon:yes stop_codon:yes gene_type:complete
MYYIRKIFRNCLLLLLVFNTFLFSQDVELITQKINVENAIRDKVNVTINKLLQQSQYVIIVNARMDLKPFSLSNGDSDVDKQSNNSYSAIPGLLPSVPQNIKQNTGSTYQYASDKYLLYGLDIAVYLESSVATGAMRKNIESLIKESIPEIQDCDDCIRFETMNMSSTGSSNTYDDLLEKIEKLEADKRSAEQQILNWKFDELEKQLALSEDARTEWEKQARQREKSRQIADSLRLVNLESIEKEYRKKQDSLYLVTSLKLDEALRGRLESSDQVTDKLMEIIKSGMDPNADKDLLDRPKDSGISSTVLVLIIVGAFCILTLAGVIMLTKSGSNKTVYLKPKESGKPEGAASDIPVVNNPVNTQSAPVATFNPTSANENTDVARSDLKDLRQSAVALGVSQKDGSNQIVQDWLDTGSDSGSENNDAAESDVEE